MAARCVVEKGYHHRFHPPEIPEEFDALRPNYVSMGHGCTDLQLYERGDLYLYLRIDSYDEMQRAHIFSNRGGGQTSVDLWNSRPEHMASLHPSGALLSIFWWSLGDEIEWIILPTEIQVYRRSPYSGVSDERLHTAALDESARRAIESAAAQLGPDFRGRHYDAEGVMDGVTLSITFAPDDKTRDDRIALSNIWRPEIKPLLDAVSATLPDELKIKFEESMREMESFRTPHCTIRTWAEVRAREAQFEGHLPWWCFWPRFADPIE